MVNADTVFKQRSQRKMLPHLVGKEIPDMRKVLVGGVNVIFVNLERICDSPAMPRLVDENDDRSALLKNVSSGRRELTG